jgi:hypothetical protein
MFRGGKAPRKGTHPVKVNKKLLAALCGASAVLLAVSGCSSDDTGKKRDDWAKGVCDQAAGQIKKIDDANTSISKVDSAGKPQDVKDADSGAFQTISDAYKSLAGIFTQAGAAPGGDEGEKFQQNAVSVFNSLSSQYTGLKKQVDGLDSTDQAKFADGLKGVSDSLNKTTANAQTSLDTLRDGDTGKALAQQPGCQRVAGGPSPTAS